MACWISVIGSCGSWKNLMRRPYSNTFPCHFCRQNVDYISNWSCEPLISLRHHFPGISISLSALILIKGMTKIGTLSLKPLNDILVVSNISNTILYNISKRTKKMKSVKFYVHVMHRLEAFLDIFSVIDHDEQTGSSNWIPHCWFWTLKGIDPLFSR